MKETSVTTHILPRGVGETKNQPSGGRKEEIQRPWESFLGDDGAMLGDDGAMLFSQQPDTEGSAHQGLLKGCSIRTA